MTMTVELASSLAQLPLAGLRREFPNKADHVVNDAGDVKRPRDLHPAFYGCFDWHSSVHGHWMLVRLLKRFPQLPEAGAIRATLDDTLAEANLAVETRYLDEPNRQSFERTYGWAWLLKLAEELHGWPDGARWAASLAPLTDAIVARYCGFLPKQTYPIRTGVHPNTAFGLAFAHDYARAVSATALADLVVERARAYFGDDADYPAAWEPGGEDFLSPAMVEGDLMRRVLPPGAFAAWLERFLPRGLPPSLQTPAIVADRSDPKLAHLDGLNLSRAWCMRAIAAALPAGSLRDSLTRAGDVHARAGLANVATGDYAGEHWLASFAVYLLG
jgi:hypothetical protein